MADVANFCNAFPNVEMSFEVQDAEDVTAGDAVTLVVNLEREGEEDEDEPEGGWGKVSRCSLDSPGGASVPPMRLVLCHKDLPPSSLS